MIVRKIITNCCLLLAMSSSCVLASKIDVYVSAGLDQESTASVCRPFADVSKDLESKAKDLGTRHAEVNFSILDGQGERLHMTLKPQSHESRIGYTDHRYFDKHLMPSLRRAKDILKGFPFIITEGRTFTKDLTKKAYYVLLVKPNFEKYFASKNIVDQSEKDDMRHAIKRYLPDGAHITLATFAPNRVRKNSAVKPGSILDLSLQFSNILHEKSKALIGKTVYFDSVDFNVIAGV